MNLSTINKVFKEKQMRNRTCLAQQNEHRLTSMNHAWLSLYVNSAERSIGFGPKIVYE